MSPFLRPVQALNDAGVDYVVVGGLAVTLHGHVRLTNDIDIVVSLDAPNALKAIESLLAIGLVPRAPVDARLFADPEARRAWAKEKNMTVFSLVDPSHPFLSIDLFVEYPLPYAELSADAATKQLSGETVRVCSLESLIRMKRLAGRPIDLEDVAALEDANGD